MGELDLRIDPLTDACVVVTPWRQHRTHLPENGSCPFCPGGLEAPRDYDVSYFTNRWPGLPRGRHEVVLHSPKHDASFPSLGEAGTAQVMDLWSARTAALGARGDVKYVFAFENRGRAIGATIDHPHSQIFGFPMVPPIAQSELSKSKCNLCDSHDEALLVTSRPGWLATVPWAPSWPYEMLITADDHLPDLPAAGKQLRAELGAVLVDCLTRVEQLLGADAPYMLWAHQRPTDGADWPIAHLHLHLVPAARKPDVIRHLASAELGAGVFFDPVDPRAAAQRLRSAGERSDRA
jgi:UDPglucose--hexose-1-phosphate uridylyltransferase